MHRNLLKAKEILEESLECVVEKTCPEKATKTDICLIKEIVDGIHTINKIVVDDSMRIQFYEEIECMKKVKDIEELMEIFDEYMMKKEKEGYSYQKEKDRRYKGGAY